MCFERSQKVMGEWNCADSPSKEIRYAYDEVLTLKRVYRSYLLAQSCSLVLNILSHYNIIIWYVILNQWVFRFLFKHTVEYSWQRSCSDIGFDDLYLCRLYNHTYFDRIIRHSNDIFHIYYHEKLLNLPNTVRIEQSINGEHWKPERQSIPAQIILY